ncbi:MAG: 5-oxoprolinase subunit PxpA [Chitinophagaceae bacterium]
MPNVDLNCDMGESSHLYPYNIDKDLALLKYISSVNLACGFHAGDAHTMHQLVEAAVEMKIAIGAHPGFKDKANFGRENRQLSPEKIYDIVLYQLGALQAFLKAHRAKMHHVKPHGALYNMAAKEKPIADAICNAMLDFDESLMLYGLSGSEMIRSAEQLGLQTASEVFADRTYQADGSLTPRSAANALIEDGHEALRQVLQMVQQGTVIATDGTNIPVKCKTICIHGDADNALSFAETIYELLRQHHVNIQQP